MRGHRSGIPLALAGAVVAAGAATLILRPRGGLIEPAAVDAAAYFSRQQLDRASDFRDVQRLIGLGGLAVGGATLALLALRPPARVAGLLERAGTRPVLGGAAVGAGLSLALVATGLPLSLWAHERAVDVGLSTQSLGPWLSDVALSAGIGALVAAGGGAVAMVLLRRFPRRWWIPAAGVVAGFAVLTTYVSPIVVDPLFNDFEPLPPGELRSEVLELAESSEVDVGEVYRVDASRRTTAINAYVGGIGHTKRVVLYDNLIEDYPPDQVRSVVAHELGHVHNRDLPRGLLWIAIVAPAGMLLVQRMSERIGGPHPLPAVAFSLALVSLGATCAGNALSRPVEARADAFALERTRDPDAFIRLERSLAIRNIGDPDPPKLHQLLFGTHPTTIERIGVGEAFRRD